MAHLLCSTCYSLNRDKAKPRSHPSGAFSFIFKNLEQPQWNQDFSATAFAK